MAVFHMYIIDMQLLKKSEFGWVVFLLHAVIFLHVVLLLFVEIKALLG